MRRRHRRVVEAGAGRGSLVADWAGAEASCGPARAQFLNVTNVTNTTTTTSSTTARALPRRVERVQRALMQPTCVHIAHTRCGESVGEWLKPWALGRPKELRRASGPPR